jgi:hypothetical protein
MWLQTALKEPLLIGFEQLEELFTRRATDSLKCVYRQLEETLFGVDLKVFENHF